MSAKLRSVLLYSQSVVFLLLVGAVQVSAQNIQQCQKIDCRCDGLWNVWGEACKTQESQLIEQCSENEGKISRYCHWQGPNAFPSVLSSLQAAKAYRADQLEQAKTSFNSKLWSMQQDFNSSQELYSGGDVKSAAAIAKRVDKQASSAISQGLVLLSLYRQLEDEEARSLALDQLRGSLSDQENRFLAWSAAMSNAGQLKLARRFSRYSGNMAEAQGLLLDALAEFDSAANAWQRAANRAEQLLEASTKPRIWKFYRAQAASRYSKAASSTRRYSGNGDSFAAQAENLWGLSQLSAAKPE
ncbi:hypothetical protein [uncultured Pseudoteredinibacter sp.]|uniref:hypothetical protein n=1 Tax=uncultured Pseudoteredinibacter sp. TaxID=1641701 RepID=UPI00262D466B|nr:hypothetical protein [uncultured Pseudoteredinibacter sp.]